ncbi:MAG TPA: hypothetical protein VKI00_23315 [Mycobacterium sp.]|uniref:hypothetical protein n=1 Tax=Mycobacterium sp. TaxID=1785 RepID=UPI002D092272|nr:hypothetical protein [Mycobacterium sp.]HME78466.1 hypothetical protein [Mycobacterium sp.]
MLFLVLWPAERIPNPRGDLSLIEETAKFIWLTLGSEAIFKWVQLAAWTITILAIVFFVLWLVFKFQKKNQEESDSRPRTWRNVLQRRHPPGTAPGGRHAAPTPVDDHQEAPGPDRKPGVV